LNSGANYELTLSGDSTYKNEKRDALGAPLLAFTPHPSKPSHDLRRPVPSNGDTGPPHRRTCAPQRRARPSPHPPEPSPPSERRAPSCTSPSGPAPLNAGRSPPHPVEPSAPSSGRAPVLHPPILRTCAPQRRPVLTPTPWSLPPPQAEGLRPASPILRIRAPQRGRPSPHPALHSLPPHLLRDLRPPAETPLLTSPAAERSRTKAQTSLPVPARMPTAR
jgi:hypothetical protein